MKNCKSLTILLLQSRDCLHLFGEHFRHEPILSTSKKIEIKIEEKNKNKFDWTNLNWAPCRSQRRYLRWEVISVFSAELDYDYAASKQHTTTTNKDNKGFERDGLTKGNIKTASPPKLWMARRKLRGKPKQVITVIRPANKKWVSSNQTKRVFQKERERIMGFLVTEFDK